MGRRCMSESRWRYVVMVFLLSVFTVSPLLAADQPVKAWQQKVVIPTYLIDAPDPNPQFYFGGVSQGAQQRVYPYPLYDNLTTNKDDKAFNQLSKATWSAAWRSPGYFEMAQFATLHGVNDAAITYTASSLDSNTQNVRALALRAALLRHTGHDNQARAAVAALRSIDALDVRAISEQWLAGKDANDAAKLTDTLHIFPNTGLEIAADYMNAGLWSDGAAALTLLTDTASDASKVSPLAWYYLGYLAQKMNQPEKAKKDSPLAAKSTVDYVFPFQMEMITVLEVAMDANPSDARAILPGQSALRLAARPRGRTLAEISLLECRFPSGLSQPGAERCTPILRKHFRMLFR